MSKTRKKQKTYPFLILDQSGSASSDVARYLRTPKGRADLETFGRIRVHSGSVKIAKQPDKQATGVRVLPRREDTPPEKAVQSKHG